MQELHPEIYSRALDKAGRNDAKHEVKGEQSRNRDFDPQVSFKVSTIDKIREGYLHL